MSNILFLPPTPYHLPRQGSVSPLPVLLCLPTQCPDFLILYSKSLLQNQFCHFLKVTPQTGFGYGGVAQHLLLPSFFKSVCRLFLWLLHICAEGSVKEQAVFSPCNAMSRSFAFKANFSSNFETWFSTSQKSVLGLKVVTFNI